MKEVNGKVKMIIVPVPKNADDFRVIHESTRVAYFTPKYKRFDIPKQEYEIIGKLSTLTEDQAKQLVGTIHIEIAPSPSNDWGGDFDYGYIDYGNPGEYAGWNGDAGCFRHATDSFKSLLKSTHVLLKEWTDEPKMNHWGASMEDYIQFTSDKEEFDKIPEDFLILKINE
jgi:hypothetical protein